MLGSMAVLRALGVHDRAAGLSAAARAPRLNVLITAIGVSLFLENIGQRPSCFGTQPQKMPTLLPDTRSGTSPTSHPASTCGHRVALALMACWSGWSSHPKLGRAMRAVSYDFARRRP
jgi:branched-chain amino acid transport system permease protein